MEDKQHKSSIIFYWIGSHPVVGRAKGKRWRGGLINGKGEENETRLPHNFYLSISVF